MPIIVKFFSNIREATGVKEVTMLKAKDVKSLLDKLVEKFGPKFANILFKQRSSKLRRGVIVLLNGHSIRTLDGLNTPLQSGDVVITDVVAILQTVGGG